MVKSVSGIEKLSNVITDTGKAISDVGGGAINKVIDNAEEFDFSDVVEPSAKNEETHKIKKNSSDESSIPDEALDLEAMAAKANEKVKSIDEELSELKAKKDKLEEASYYYQNENNQEMIKKVKDELDKKNDLINQLRSEKEDLNMQILKIKNAQSQARIDERPFLEKIIRVDELVSNGIEDVIIDNYNKNH